MFSTKTSRDIGMVQCVSENMCDSQTDIDAARGRDGEIVSKSLEARKC